MNYRMIVKRLGTVLLIEGACMALPMIVSAIYGQGDFLPFLISAAITSFIGFAMQSVRITSSDIYIREGLAIVAMSWIFFSLFGALPYIISEAIPNVLNAIFESVSGFTTTGASILTDVEALPKGILFWRCFTNWMGGMGVLVLMLAISLRQRNSFLSKAESRASPDKFVPKIGKTAKILYLMYVLLTLSLVIFLLFGGMPLYDSLVHAFSTAGTGGFSIKNASIGAYGSLYIEIVTAVFMFLFGINFTLYFLLLKGNLKNVLKDEELRFYVIIVLTAIALITFNTYGRLYQTVGEALRYSSFQVSSIITTTGFSTFDFNQWPLFSQIVIVILMLMGAMAGSTGGGLKCVRALVLFKSIRREIVKSIHPRAVNAITLNGKKAEESNVYGILTYFAIYIILIILGTLLISIDGKDFLTTLTSVISCINNIGPGLGAVGPAGNFAGFSPLSKIVMSLLMLRGRLEIFPILILTSRGFWKKNNI